MIKTVLSSCFILAIAAGLSQAQEAPPASPAAPEAAAKATPADGHVIHVTAPHLIDGKVRGPFHHYCKIVSPEPFIECLLYETEDNNAKLIGVEYIVAKTVTRDEKVLPKKARKKVWHDHSVEGVIGNVKVLDMPPDKAKEFADTVAKTDGIIFFTMARRRQIADRESQHWHDGWACRTPMTWNHESTLAPSALGKPAEP